jgi:indole-3-glycerol phosphate synthase/phosphoribosylanthranilate isomerase
MVLDRIVARTREDVGRRQRDVPVARLLAGLPRSDRDFEASLRRPRTGFIMECKRASPSEGLIREPYDPATIAQAYAPFADAISVLTDGPFFQGSREHLKQVREAVTLPVLCKDFVVGPYQVVEARAAGADAVLLMLSVLDDAAYRDCADTAASVGIATLTEVHSADELDRALRLGAGVIGVNNRDLTTMTVDLATTTRLAPAIPEDRVVICESGIRTHDEVRSLAPLVDGFLVGTTLMRSADVPQAVRTLVFGTTKVCGLTRPEDARAAWEAGATHGGVIFAAESRRRVDPDQAVAISRAAPLNWVGVFVNDTVDRIVDLAGQLGLAAVQLHGEETREQVGELRKRLPEGTEVWKAVRVRDRVPPLLETGADRMVLDTWREGQRGGTGERFDWSLVRGHPDRKRIVLGGGLGSGLAEEAETLGVWGLDVNSGVEDRPGSKDPARLAAFFGARRGTGRKRSVS